MNSKFIIATDLGSQSIKTILYNYEGEIISNFVKESKIYLLNQGNLTYHGDDFYKSTIENIRQILNTILVYSTYETRGVFFYNFFYNSYF